MSPTTSPTASPTPLPTVAPSQSPTLSPSAPPTASPSTSPSSSPTPSPSANPTTAPTHSPTTVTATTVTATTTNRPCTGPPPWCPPIRFEMPRSPLKGSMSVGRGSTSPRPGGRWGWGGSRRQRREPKQTSAGNVASDHQPLGTVDAGPELTAVGVALSLMLLVGVSFLVAKASVRVRDRRGADERSVATLV